MVSQAYVPHRGDVVWLDFNPTKGHEQAHVRPALVVSPKTYNQKTSLALVCPITSTNKGYPFEVPVVTKKVSVVILADHLRSVDWRARRASYIGRVKPATFTAVQTKLELLIAGE